MYRTHPIGFRTVITKVVLLYSKASAMLYTFPYLPNRAH